MTIDCAGRVHLEAARTPGASPYDCRSGNLPYLQQSIEGEMDQDLALP